MNSKNRTWKVVALAAVAVVGAATASAQSSLMTGNVPFAFSIGQSVRLGPGNYAVSRTGNLWLFRDQETGRAVAVTNTVAHQGSAMERPALTFECIAGSCRLSSIHAGGHDLGADIPRPRGSKLEAVKVAVIELPLSTAGD